MCRVDVISTSAFADMFKWLPTLDARSFLREEPRDHETAISEARSAASLSVA